MGFAHELEAAKAGHASAEQLGELARSALAGQREDEVLPLLGNGATSDARLWQWKALLDGARDEHADALNSFAQAARLAPSRARRQSSPPPTRIRRASPPRSPACN